MKKQSSSGFALLSLNERKESETREKEKKLPLLTFSWRITKSLSDLTLSSLEPRDKRSKEPMLYASKRRHARKKYDSPAALSTDAGVTTSKPEAQSPRIKTDGNQGPSH